MSEITIKRLNKDIENSPLIVIDKTGQKMFISSTDNDALDCYSMWINGLDAKDFVNGICCECVSDEQ
jgi:hypothetical protein